MHTTQITASCAHNEDSGFVDSDHALNDVLDFANSQLQDQADRFLILGVLLDHLFEQLLCFLAVFSRLDCGVTRDTGVLFHRTETDDLVTIVDQLIDEPLEREIGIVVLICAAKECSTASRALVSFVLVVQSQGEICRIRIIKGIEGDAPLVGPKQPAD